MREGLEVEPPERLSGRLRNGCASTTDFNLYSAPAVRSLGMVPVMRVAGMARGALPSVVLSVVLR
jgi:hypothetical protein